MDKKVQDHFNLSDRDAATVAEIAAFISIAMGAFITPDDLARLLFGFNANPDPDTIGEWRKVSKRRAVQVGSHFTAN